MVITQWHRANEKNGPARAVAFFAGALTPLAFSPFNVWLLTLFIPALFWWATARARPPEAFLRGWLFGFGFFGTGTSWVFSSMRTVETGLFISLALTSLFCLALGLLFALQALLPALARHRWKSTEPPGIRTAFALAAVWLVFEAIRSTLFTGMPWLLWGTVVTDTPFSGWLPVLGVYGTSLLLLMVAGSLWLGLVRLRRGLMAGCATVTLLVAGWPLGQVEMTRAMPDRVVTVAALQSNVSQLDKWAPDNLRPTLTWYKEQSGTLTEADLLIWPETAMTAFPGQIPDYLKRLDDQLSAHGQGLIAGLPVRDGADYYNAVRAWGLAEGEYRKRHLVPFGEYLPLRDWLEGLIRFFSLPMSGFSAGADNQPPLTLNHPAGELRLGVLICYEAAYPGLARQQASRSNLIVVVSNDAWFGRSIAPAQHLQITRTRALENGRPMVRATQNGLTALVDHRGRLLDQAEPRTATHLTGPMTPREGSTVFQSWGSLPASVVTGLLLLGGARTAGRR